MRTIIAATLLLGLALPAQAETAEPVTIEQLHQAIADAMRDPEATRFRQTRIVRRIQISGAIVCGEINAKNAFGGYIGFQSFIAMVAGSAALVSLESDYGYAHIAERCRNQAAMATADEARPQESSPPIPMR